MKYFALILGIVMGAGYWSGFGDDLLLPSSVLIAGAAAGDCRRQDD